MEEHTKSVNKIASVVQGFFERGESYRISHGSTNSTRPRNGAKASVVEIGMLSNVVSVDREARTALVEPNVPMDRLVEATMRYNLVPPVVMEFPGITAGGGFAGTSGESSSFRHGFFNDTINYVEMILGNGEIVKASRTERADLFHGAAGAAGTLGVTTLMELRLVEAKKYVKCTYYRTKSVAEGIKRIEENTKDSKLDYIDGILYSKDHGVIITGQLTDEKPEEQPLQRFSDASDPWFYMHVQEKTKDMSLCSSTTEYIPLGEYLFRYDRAGFWVGRHGYTYFKYIPFNGFFRWLLDDFSHTRMLYHALHASGISSRFVVQDLGLPYDTAEAFIDHVADDLHIWPLWLCPLKETSTPTFHPSTAEVDKPLIDVSGESGTPSQTMSRPMLNIGVWGWGPQNHDEFIKKNRDLETKLTQLGGRKWLYAHTYYSEEEFWNVYNKPWYQALREKYNATTLPTIYDKVKVRAPSSKGWTRDFANKWPIGGLYGMWVALLSGDYAHHRNAGWKYR